MGTVRTTPRNCPPTYLVGGPLRHIPVSVNRPLNGTHISRGQQMRMSKEVLAGAPQPSGESQKRYVVWPCVSPNAMTLAGFTR
jgi:hypothetical protein